MERNPSQNGIWCIFALKSDLWQQFLRFLENQITESHGELPDFIYAEFGNVKVINHRLHNYVCALLHFDTHIFASVEGGWSASPTIP